MNPRRPAPCQVPSDEPLEEVSTLMIHISVRTNPQHSSCENVTCAVAGIKPPDKGSPRASVPAQSSVLQSLPVGKSRHKEVGAATLQSGAEVEGLHLVWFLLFIQCKIPA